MSDNKLDDLTQLLEQWKTLPELPLIVNVRRAALDFKPPTPAELLRRELLLRTPPDVRGITLDV